MSCRSLAEVEVVSGSLLLSPSSSSPDLRFGDKKSQSRERERERDASEIEYPLCVLFLLPRQLFSISSLSVAFQYRPFVVCEFRIGDGDDDGRDQSKASIANCDRWQAGRQSFSFYFFIGKFPGGSSIHILAKFTLLLRLSTKSKDYIRTRYRVTTKG